MRYLLLLVCLLSVGCIPAVVEQPLVLDEPIVLTSDTPVRPQEDAGQPAPKVEKTEPPKAAPAPLVKKPTYRWTFPGDLGNHLRSAHGADVTGMSHAEMLRLHDELHNSALAEPVKENVVIQYSTTWCGICKTDERSIIPNWTVKGWKFRKVDETANASGVYPRYEIRWADGRVRQHTGSLSTWKN
jgi:hypothetical protein